MTKSVLRIVVSTIVMVAFAVALISFKGHPVSQESTNTVMAAGAAWQYCVDNGGLPLRRLPAYGTNDPNPLILSGSQVFCQFTSTDTSRIRSASTSQLIAIDSGYSGDGLPR